MTPGRRVPVGLASTKTGACRGAVAAAVAVFAVLAASGTFPVRPDDAPAEAPYAAFVDHVTVSRVRWPVIVLPEKKATDEEKARCATLGPGDFEVTEDKHTVPVLEVERGSQATVFALLIDASRSMAPRLEEIKEEAALLAADLARDHDVLVASFADALSVNASWTRDAAEARAAARSVKQGEKTALSDALAETLDLLQGRGERCVLVLFSDGEDSASVRHGAQEVLDRAVRTRSLRIFPIVVASHEDLRFTGRLRLLAHATGGRFELVRESRDLREVFTAMRAHLAHEIVLTWRPSTTERSSRRGGEKGPVRVRVKARVREGLPCRAREAVPERILLPAPPAGVTLD